ncbi:MAG: M24 family metallopeptidase [Pseudomonadota bacterium]
MQLEKIQQVLKERNLDGWLLCDFHNKDLIAYRITGLDSNKFTSRRWFYFIPADGKPWKLVSRVENTKLDPLPGDKHLYLSWRELHASLADLLKGRKQVAMNYSALNNIPYVSMVDAGLMELIRKTGIEVISSADLVTIFEASISAEGYRLQKTAADHLDEIVHEAFKKIGESAGRKGGGGKETEYSIQQFILGEFMRRNMHWDDAPIVGVNEHPADPHFEPTEATAKTFKEGDCVLIDLWARMKDDEAVFADITWCAFIGESPPEKYEKAFNTIVRARDAAVEFIRKKFSKGEKVYGFEVDDACRNVVIEAGFGDYFIHRTGHNIGREVHGNGVNIDNLETKDERELIANVCFSVEPGIYVEGEFGARTEIDVFIKEGREVEVTTKAQEKLLLL